MQRWCWQKSAGNKQAGSRVVFESSLCYCFVFYMVLNYLFRINGFV